MPANTNLFIFLPLSFVIVSKLGPKKKRVHVFATFFAWNINGDIYVVDTACSIIKDFQ